MLKKKKNVNKIKNILVALIVIIITLGFYIKVEAIDLNQGTITPIYRPKWEKVSSTINIDEDNLEDSTISIVLRGNASNSQTLNSNASINYSSTVTGDLTINDITVYVNNVKADWVTKALTPPADTTVVDSVTYTLTLSGFEEAERKTNVPFKDWSGNIKIRIGGRGEAPETYTADVLVDKYGNQSMMATDETGTWIDVTYQDAETDHNTNGTMFVDFLEPEFTYEYSNTTIVGGDVEKVTVVFDVTDQYFTSSQITADLITVKVANEVVNSTVNVSKTLTKIKDVYYDKTAGTNYVNTGATGTGIKVGERYQLEITGLDKGDAFKYSGYMTLEFPAGTKDASGNLISGVIDDSGNLNVGTTITIGLDDKDGNPGADSAGSGTIVDVVDPLWKVNNIEINENLANLKNSTVTLELSATDKYYLSNVFEEARANGTLADAIRNNILLYIDGELDGDADRDGVLETGETPTITKTLSTATNLTPAGTGVKYTLTLSNWDAERYSGTARIVIPAGTITDQVVDGRNNASNQQEFIIGHIDFTKPVITKVSSTNDPTAKTQTIVFKATDKFMVMEDLITIPTVTNPSAPDEITVYVDNEVATGITRTLTSEEITEVVNGVTVKGHQYTLVLSNFEQTRTTINRAREFSDWSGTVRIDIAQGAVRDEEVTNANGEVGGGNVNDLTPITGEFADFIKPNVTYEYSSTDIVRNHEDKTQRTFTMVFDVTDKYFTSSAFATAFAGATTDEARLAVLQEYLTIWIDGVDVTRVDTVTKKIIEISNVTATINKTTDIANKTITNNVTNAVIGKRFTLEISNLEQDTDTAMGNDYLNYSGVITVAFNTSKPLATDSTGNSNVAGSITAPSITSGVTTPDGSGSGVIVDLVDPLWEQGGTAEARPYDNYAKIPIKGTDKYIQTNNLQASDITITVTTPSGTTIVNGASASTKGMTLTVEEDTSVTLAYGKQYIVELEGYSSDAYQVKLTLRDGILVDTSGNTSQETSFILFTSLAGTSTEKQPTSEFLAQNKEEGQVIPQRQYVEQVIFQNNLSGMNSTKWDVSQLNDGSIWAWYTTREVSGTTLYTVYIGSYIIINGNVNSSYLFANLGSDANCKVTGDTTDNEFIENLYILQLSSVTNMSHMFDGCGYAKMQSLDLGTAFNTMSVTNMSGMFQNCGYTAMISLTLPSSFDTSKVTNMEDMFNSCGYTAMTSLTLPSSFNTSNVTNMNTMFDSTGHTAMINLNLGSNFNTSSVTKMNSMFDECGYNAMTSLNLGNNFDTSNVTIMYAMFRKCGYNAMTNLNLGAKFNTSKVSNMRNMFNECGYKQLKSLDLGDLFYTTSATNMETMFSKCGTTEMTVLDLGPAFTQIASTYTNMFTNSGKSGLCTIYAPEAIYSSMNSFKLNATATEGILSYTRGIINPIYKPEWEKVSSSINESNKTMTVVVKGSANKTFTNGAYTGTYVSDVTSALSANKVTVYVDGELAEGIDASDITVTGPTTSTNGTTGKTEVQYTITISNLEQLTRFLGKNFKEWSGNVELQLAKGTLIDTWGSYIGQDAESNPIVVKDVAKDTLGNIVGNQNLAVIDIDTSGTMENIVVEETTKLTANTETTEANMFADFIKPEYTYTYSTTNPDINTGVESVTVVFDVTDKYFESTALASDTNGSLITVKVDGDENANTPITKVLTKIKDVYYDATAGINYVNPGVAGTGRKVGERYQLVITGLDREDGFTYSGPMTLTFAEGTEDASGNLTAGIRDNSGNLSPLTAITMGVNEPGGEPDDEIVVDVVDPIWEVRNSAGVLGQIDKTTDANGNVTATMTLIGKDKYFKQSTLTKDDIQIKVDGIADISIDADGDGIADNAPDLVKTLSEAVYIKLDGSGNYVETTSSDPDVIGVKYQFSISGLKETDDTFFANRADYNTNPETGRPYREYSGEMAIVIPANKLEDETGNMNNLFTIDLEHVDTLKPEVIKVSSTANINATNPELSTHTIVFDIVDKYINSSSITATDTSMIHVYFDGEEAESMTKPATEAERNANSDKVFKEITNIQTLTDTVNGVSQVVGYRYTLVLSGIEKPRTLINYDREFTDWSGKLSIKIDANTAKDTSNLANDATILYGNEEETTDKTKADHVDYVKPDATYEYSSVQDGVSDVTDKNGKTYEMVFDITDKFFQTNSLSITDFTILMSAEEEIGEGEDGYYDIMANTSIEKALEAVDITNEVVVDVVNGVEVKETRVIGKRYTLRLSNLEKLQKIEGNYYLDYSGSITITIPAGKVTDTSGNGNDATSITSGIDIPGGEVTDIAEIDVVQPLWERTAFTTDIHAKTATITLLGSDKYFYEYDLEPGDEGYDADLANNSTLTLEEIKLYINGIETTGTISGTTKTLKDAEGNIIGKLTIDSETKLIEERLVQTEYSDGDVDTGYTTETVQYGVRYVLNITDLAITANQIKIHLPEGSLVDKSGNENRVTEFLVYNTLRKAQDISENWEDSSTSGFLSNSTIQRQNIEKVEFVANLNSAPTIGTESAEGVILCWDVSAVRDNSILAWATQTTEQATKGVYTVYIGSNDDIYGNINSRYLFSYIGYSTNCTDANTIVGLSLLDTRNVTDMSFMFKYCGYKAMTNLTMDANFDTSNVTKMEEMFYSCGYTAMTGLTLPTSFNTSKVTQMEGMFQSCGYTAMISLTLPSSFDTGNVTDMEDMFNSCGYTAMTSLTLPSAFNTSKVTNMNTMFNSCGREAMGSLNLGSNFNTISVTTMNSMFDECGYKAMTSLNLGDKFDTSNVKIMYAMFRKCGYTLMTSLNLGLNFNTSKATNMRNMFSGCGYQKLPSLDLGDVFYTTSATNMQGMFNDCGKTSMTTLDLGPAFTKIASTNTNIFTDVGKSGACTIYASESIYQDMKTFKLNATSGTTITLDVLDATNNTYRATINPIYKPEWEKVSTTIDTTNKKISVTFKGYANEIFTNGTYTGTYSSDITSLITAGNDSSNLILVKVDGEIDGDTDKDGILETGETPSITKTVEVLSQTATEVQYKITLSGIEENLRQSGKNFLEWSGNIAIQPVKGTLIDKYGSYLTTQTQTDEDGNSVEVQLPVTGVFADASGNYIGNKNMIAIDDADGNWLDIELRDTTQDAATGNWTDTLSENTTGKMFTDYIIPEFTYEYHNETIDTNANTVIDYANNKVTVVFDVTDKYFKEAKFTKDDITVALLNDTTFEEETSNINTDIQKTLALKTIETEYKVGDITYKTDGSIWYPINGVDTKVGERYELVITNLESANGVGYSGPMSLSFPAGVVDGEGNLTKGIMDNSGNLNVGTTITIGVDGPDNHEEHDTPVVVDVVNPMWVGLRDVNTINRTTDKVEIKILGIDKYYKTNTLDTGDITVYLDLDGNGTIEDTEIVTVNKQLTQIEATELATLAQDSELSNYDDVRIGYTLTLSNFGTTPENLSGMTKIKIADGTIEDISGNLNVNTDPIFAGNIIWEETNETLESTEPGYPRYTAFRNDIVDFIDPVIRYQYSSVVDAENPDIDYEEKEVTVKFTLLEKYLLESTLIKADGTLNTDAIKIFIDVDGTFTDVTDRVNKTITPQNITNGIEYTLVVSNLEQNPYYDAFSFSGPMQLVFTAGTIEDTSGNKNSATTITIDTDDGDNSGDGVIVDVVDPIVKITSDAKPLSYRNAYNSINRESNTDTVTVRIRIEDKYLDKTSGTLITNKDQIKVKVQKPNGTIIEDATKVANPVTVSVIEKTISDTDKYEYEITLGNFTSNEGITSIIIPEDSMKDLFGNGNKETEVYVGRADWTGDGRFTAFNNSIVDFTDPTWTKATSSITRDRANQVGTVTLKLLGYDIYYQENTLDEDYITVSVNGTEVGTISKLLEPITDTTELTNLAEQAGLDFAGRTITDVIVGYTLTLGNFGTNDGTVTIKIADGTIKDSSGNGNITDDINVGNITWIETDVETDVNNPKYTAFRSGIVDFIKPVIKYQYAENVNPLLDRTDEDVQIVFTATDTNFLESNIGLEDMLIYIDDMLVYGTGANADTDITPALSSEAITDGSANGLKYTLTLSALELNTLLTGEMFERHSGVIKIVISANQLADSSGNKNTETTIIVDNGDGDDQANGVIVDFVNPIIYYHDKYINWEDRYVLITVRATDRFYDTSTKLQPSDLSLYEQNADGDYIQITSIPQEDITITPVANAYGYDFVIRLDNFDEEFKMKIAIAGGKIKDTSGNYNDPTDIFVDLDNRKPTWEYVSTDTSGFEPETGGAISFNVKGVDKFLDITNSNLEAGDIKVLLDGVDITDNEGIEVQVAHTGTDENNADDGEKSKSYKIDVTGLTTIGTYTLVFEAGTLVDEFGNQSAATTISFSKSVIDENTGNYTNITYHVSPDHETVHSSYVHELMSVNTTGTNSENTTYRPSTLGELHNNGKNPLFAEPMYAPVVNGYTLSYVYEPKSFAGWAVADSYGNPIYYTDSTLTTISTTPTTFTRVYGLYDEIPNTVTNLKAVWQDATVVFVSNTDGDNSNDGKLPENAVKDLATAYSKLNGTGTAENNIIVIMDEIEWNSASTLTGNATITSLYAGVDYSLDGAELKISSNMTVNGDVIFDNLELYADSTTVSDGTNYLGNGTYTNMLISNYSGNITIGRRIVTPTDKYTFGAVVGGNYTTETSTGTLGTHTIRIESGKYNNIIAGSSLATPTTANKFIYHEVIIGNMRDTAISTNSKLTITGYFAIGENEQKCYPNGATGGSDSYNKNYADVTLYSGTFTGTNKFTKATENFAIYLRSINGQTDGKMTFTVYGGNITGNIYGGARTATTYGTTVVNTMKYYGGTLTGNIFGQSANDAFGGSSDITLQGIFTMTGNVFGGSNSGTTGSNGAGNATITINSASVTVNGNIYGGSNGVNNTGYLDGKTTITLKSGTVTNIYGSGNNSGNSNTTAIIVENGLVSESIFGGAYNGQSGSATITVLGGTISGNIYGGNENTSQTYMDNDTTLQDVSIIIGDTTVATTPTINGTIYGSGKYDKLDEVTIQLVKCTNTTSVFGGSNANFETANVNITLNGMTVNEIYGGGQNAGTVEEAFILLLSGTATEVYGGGYNAVVTSSGISFGDENTLEGTATVTTIYGGSNTSGKVESTRVVLISGNLTNVFGGGNSAPVGESVVILMGITIDTIHGGSKDTGIADISGVGIATGTVNNVFGGGLDVGATETFVLQIGGTVKNIYGGNDSTEEGSGGETGTTNIEIMDATVENIYGGNYLKGTTQNSYITIHGDSTVTGNIFGGGYKSNIATTDNPGSTSINIVQGTIYGDINGGSEEAIVYGTTNINVGYEAFDSNARTDIEVTTDTAGNINIIGTIYGSGSTLTSGTTTVFGNTNIKMDNSTTSPITYYTADGKEKTVYGSGKGGAIYSAETDNSTIHIKDMGTASSVYEFASIEHTGKLYIGNSVLELTGRQDTTNYYADRSYTLNKITNGLTVYNNTTLYTQRGFNKVGGFNSFATLNANGTGTLAKVTITDGAITERTADNRLYTLEGVNLIFAKEEELASKTSQDVWGDVYGMTFFGMYTKERGSGDKQYDIYEPGDAVYDLANYEGELEKGFFSAGTYVEGRHRLNQVITTDGFYTNVAEYNADTGAVTSVKAETIGITDYGTYYDWIINEDIVNYSVNLIGSLYGNQAIADLVLTQGYEPEANYTITEVSMNALKNAANIDVNLINPLTIPTVSTNANNTFGLTMETIESGWIAGGQASIYTDTADSNKGTAQGTTFFKTDSSTTPGIIRFQMYNSLNITEANDLGFVNIVLTAKTTSADGTGNTFKVVIAVNLQTVVDEQKDAYVPRFTNGANTQLSYTTDSKVDLSYLLFKNMDTTPYIDGDYRVISSTVQLPAGTRLTLKDYGQGDSLNKVYYYQIPTDTSYDSTETVDGITRYIYKLSKFIEMGSTNSNYADNNSTYYHSGDGAYVLEKYDLSIDFIDATIAEKLENETYLELRNSAGTMKYDNGNTEIKYNLYANKNAITTETISNEGSSYSIVETLDIPITINASILERAGILDTKYYGQKAGIAIEIVNEQGVRIKAPELQNFKLTNVDDATEVYTADHFGVIRVPIMEALSTFSADYKLSLAQSNVTPGLYKAKVYLFTSDDGTYYGDKINIYSNEQYYNNVTSIYKEFYITFISRILGLAGVEATDDSRIISKTTGLNLEATSDADKNKAVDMTVSITQPTSASNIRVELYKRNTTYTIDEDDNSTYNGINYTLVDIAQYLDGTWEKPAIYGLTAGSSYEYMFKNKETYETIPEIQLIEFERAIKSGITTGEYKVEFKVYHEDTLVQTIKKTFIVMP